MTKSEKINFYLVPGHGAVVDCYDEEMADSFDDFLAERREEEFSLKISEGKITFFLPKQNSNEAIEGIIKEFIQIYEN